MSSFTTGAISWLGDLFKRHASELSTPKVQRDLRPQISVVVVLYNIPREAPRTLYSLSAAYQQHIAAEEYEVIVVDNGSTPPFDPAVLDKLRGNFRLIRIDPAPPLLLTPSTSA